MTNRVPGRHRQILRWVLLSLCLLAFTDTSARAQAVVEWPQFQHDAQNSGRTTASVPPGYGLRWGWFDETHIVRNFISQPRRSVTDSFEDDFQITVVFSEQVQPIIAEGKVYVGAMNGSLYALDALSGDTVWRYDTGGPILASAAYAAGTVIAVSMDGRIHGINAADGTGVWTVTTGAGINAAPKIHDDTVYVGSRDGHFYAVDAASGTLRWTYQTRIPDEPDSPFGTAPIVAPAALSADGQTVLFGAENMHFYALDARTGQEQWVSARLVGQSFLFGWPVVAGERVIIRTMSSLPGAEFTMEEVLDALPPAPSWPEEKAAILNWLAQNPHQQTLYVLDMDTGQESYKVAMGRVSGNNYTPYPPVIDQSDRVLTYWRTKQPTFVGFADEVGGGNCFGSKYCPDISALDMATGDRVTIGPNTGWLPELDNGFALTIGGSYLYGHNTFRGLHSINLATARHTFITTRLAIADCGDWRAWGAQIVLYGNDDAPDICHVEDPTPPRPYESPIGFAPPALATTAGRTLIYTTETLGGFIAAVEQR
jgi:hypothetical protein